MTDPTPAPSPAPLNATQAAAPTFGSIIGSALGAYLTSKLAPSDPLLGSTIVTLVTGVVTGLFHLVATKLGSLAI
jgi:hypothetical protein